MARHSPSGFSDWVDNSWFHQLWQVVQVLKLQSSPRPLHYHQHVWLLVWSSFYEMLCWFYARCNGTHTFQKVQHLSHQSIENWFLHKSLGDNQDIFWQIWDEPSSGQQGLSSHGWRFYPVSFLLSNHEHWIEANETCSSLDVVLGSFITSWMSRRCTLG